MPLISYCDYRSLCLTTIIPLCRSTEGDDVIISLSHTDYVTA